MVKILENHSLDVMNQIADIDGDFRIRVGMMHPKSMMDDVEGIIKAFKRDKFYKFLTYSNSKW